MSLESVGLLSKTACDCYSVVFHFATFINLVFIVIAAEAIIVKYLIIQI